MIQQLFGSAVKNILYVINETEDIEFFDCDKLMQEADYIENLQRVNNQLDDARENDEIDKLEEFEVNLKFLKTISQRKTSTKWLMRVRWMSSGT